MGLILDCKDRYIYIYIYMVCLTFYLYSMPVADNAATFPTWNFTVADTSPVWAYVSLVCVLASSFH